MPCTVTYTTAARQATNSAVTAQHNSSSLTGSARYHTAAPGHHCAVHSPVRDRAHLIPPSIHPPANQPANQSAVKPTDWPIERRGGGGGGPPGDHDLTTADWQSHRSWCSPRRKCTDCKAHRRAACSGAPPTRIAQTAIPVPPTTHSTPPPHIHVPTHPTTGPPTAGQTGRQTGSRNIRQHGEGETVTPHHSRAPLLHKEQTTASYSGPFTATH